jgi:hypothetical protein
MSRTARTWDTTGFESTWCPTPDQLQQLHANGPPSSARPKTGRARGTGRAACRPS